MTTTHAFPHYGTAFSMYSGNPVLADNRPDS